MSYESLHHRSLAAAVKERQPRQEREECYRCGRKVPARRAGTGYCTNRCYYAQTHADTESARLERDLQRESNARQS